MGSHCVTCNSTEVKVTLPVLNLPISECWRAQLTIGRAVSTSFMISVQLNLDQKLNQDLGSADPVQLSGRGYSMDDAYWSTVLGLRANYSDVTVARNAYETVQCRLAVICSNFK